MSPGTEEFEKVAVELARAAGERALAAFRTTLLLEFKGKKQDNPVTALDRDVETYRSIFDACVNLMARIASIPQPVIAEVEKGFRSNRYEKIVDRTQAIDRAVALARPRDIVLIAGKGHENYQEFGDYTIPFDDIQVARRAIEDHPVEF